MCLAFHLAVLVYNNFWCVWRTALAGYTSMAWVQIDTPLLGQEILHVCVVPHDARICVCSIQHWGSVPCGFISQTYGIPFHVAVVTGVTPIVVVGLQFMAQSSLRMLKQLTS